MTIRGWGRSEGASPNRSLARMAKIRRLEVGGDGLTAAAAISSKKAPRNAPSSKNCSKKLQERALKPIYMEFKESKASHNVNSHKKLTLKGEIRNSLKERQEKEIASRKEQQTSILFHHLRCQWLGRHFLYIVRKGDPNYNHATQCHLITSLLKIQRKWSQPLTWGWLLI